MTKVKCVDCKSFSLKNKQYGASPMAQHGCGYCDHNQKPGEYMTARYERECAKFTPASDEVVKARIDFLTK